MATEIKREIRITQQTKDNPEGISPISVLVKSKTLLSSADAPVSAKIGAIILGKQILSDLKSQLDNLEIQLEETPIEDLKKALIAEGVLAEGEKPIFVITDKTGKEHTKTLSETVTHSLNMDKFKDLVKDPAVFDALPEEYKKHDIQGKPFFSSLYREGSLGIYEKYFSMEDKTTTGLKSIKLSKTKGE